MKIHNGLLLILSFVIISQILLGLFDPVESRQAIGELSAHNRALVYNFDLTKGDCSETGLVLERGDCWHYRSRTIFSELLFVPAALFGTSYGAMKTYSLLFSLTEIFLIFLLVNREFGERSAILASATYSSVPMFVYFTQMPLIFDHRPIIVLLVALFSIPIFSQRPDAEELKRSEVFLAWTILLIGPSFSYLLSFAWAGFGAALLLLKLRGRETNLTASICFILAPVAWFFINVQINHYFGYGDQLVGRFSDRSDFHSFFDYDFWFLFIDRIFSMLGPIGAVVISFLVLQRKNWLNWSSTYIATVAALSSWLFFNLLFFQTTFATCCYYLAYPGIALVSIGSATITLDNPARTGVFSMLLLISFLGGLELHGVPNNYVERELQDYVLDNISDGEVVVTDDGIGNQDTIWQAYLMQLPEQTTHVPIDISPDEFRLLLIESGAQHVILSNYTFHSAQAASLEVGGMFCFSDIPTPEQIPDHWEQGWLSDVYPIRAGKRC
jgi:hypothetical protein